MVETISGIPELIEQGKKFTFANFEYGTPNALSDEWLVWTHHVSELVGRLSDSLIKKFITDGLSRTVIGNEQYAFDAASKLILNGLQAANRVFGAAIPASDRTVTLGRQFA